MASDLSPPPSKAVRNDLDDIKVGPFQLIAIRLVNLVIEFAGRVLDVVVLLPWPRLLWAYLRIWGAELWRSPYKWPRSFEARRVVQASGQTLRELMYGEVLVSTCAWVLARAGVGKGSSLVDVGAGRGRALLAARLRGAGARGVELWEPHVRARARKIGDARCGDPRRNSMRWSPASSAATGRFDQRKPAPVRLCATEMCTREFPWRRIKRRQEARTTNTLWKTIWKTRRTNR